MDTKIETNPGRTGIRTGALMSVILAGSAALLLSACDVDQIEEAKLPDVDVEADAGKLPSYEVVKTEEGRLPDVDVSVEGGQMPKYDVDVADVDIETKTKTVEIPYPTVEVEMPSDEKESKVN